ncbi:MAG: cyclopropane-fatty-acyl-phospholipid synthase [Roseovarius sp.]|nr:cyclopropane-fatty-acyl-phospholipid synthase [Roseovarius sp.]
MTAPTESHSQIIKASGQDAALPRRIRPLLSVLQRIEYGAIDVELPDGRLLGAKGSMPGPRCRIAILNMGFLRRLLGEGHLGFAEMYMDGWWTTPDLQKLMDFITLNNENMARQFGGAGLFRLWQRLRHRLNSNSLIGSRRNIARHYDLGNAFYSLWLDATMTYSSAMFRSGHETLEEAQENKYAAVCTRLALAPGERMLEIGCGWGAFAEYAIRERGVEVTALTISKAQYDFAGRRLFEAGLSEKGQILLRDYRDERGTYDAIASIEMIEAVGEKYWPAYFATLHDRLTPGGKAALQAITVEDSQFSAYRRRTDFIQKHIFPGGMLLCPAALRKLAGVAGLATLDTEAFGDSYSRTLRAWRHRFNDQWSRIAELGFDERFHRMWDFYLASCAANFAAGITDVMQVTYRRPH